MHDAPLVPLAVQTAPGPAWGATVAHLRTLVFARVEGSEQLLVGDDHLSRRRDVVGGGEPTEDLDREIRALIELYSQAAQATRDGGRRVAYLEKVQRARARVRDASPS